MANNQILGGIYLFAGNFAPQGYALCAGQIMPIAQNQALFALIGTYYGGNGTSTFALPDLRGRAAIGQGQSTSGSNYVIGENGGTENVTLNTSELPAHTHPLTPNFASPQTTNNPSGALPAPNGAYGTSQAGTMGASTTGPAGNNLPHPNLSPYLAITYIIATQGIFPARN